MLGRDADHFVCTGPCWFGATTHHLALLAATMQRHAEADVRFAAAVDAYVGLGAGAWVVRARLDLGAEPARTTDGTASASRLIRDALAGAEAIRIPEITHRARALLTQP